MRTLGILILFSPPFICLGQTDSMFVEMTNGAFKAYYVPAIRELTFSGLPTSVKEETLIRNVLASVALHQNFPNPFNPSTDIEYEIATPGQVELKIFDIQGRLICTLVNGDEQAGTHTVEWDGRNNAGVLVSSGTYFCTIQFNGRLLARKLALIK